jgi:hypothetical protein
MSEEIAIHVWVVAASLPAAPKLSEGGCEARRWRCLGPIRPVAATATS